MDFPKSDFPTAQELLRSGRPFVPFSEYSIHDLSQSDSPEAWIRDKLQQGKPFIIQRFQTLSSWDKEVLNNKSLVALSPSGAIPVRNCQSGRDVRMRLRELLSQADHEVDGRIRELLYAKDLNCPTAWIKALEAVLPSCLRQFGSFDLFRVLPKDIASEVLMAYVGTRNSFSGFHRCFSGTIALNLLVESEGSEVGSLCFGTDQSSQAKYDAYMEEMGKSAHTDWTNTSVEQLQSADFPIYVAHQKPGDLVIFPSATAHQIWNVSTMVTKVVWNILHTSSLASFFDYVQPIYQKQCHSDTGRVPLIPLNALEREKYTEDELPHLLHAFQHLIDEEDIETDSAVAIKKVDTQGAVVECNFCGLTIWNRHMHCEKCGDFDLCLTCFISGRSCKHITDYTWAEIFPRSHCLNIIQKITSRAGRSLHNPEPSRHKSLGTMAMSSAEARERSVDRLCHLCRDSHAMWKGTTCTKCSAFFCFRGLHRHFDIDLVSLLRNKDPWSCPKCSQVCNCRCCHFSQPYRSKNKPPRPRVKAVDSRGRVLGFVDNVFDQKRGKNASLAAPTASPQPSIAFRGQKRQRTGSDDDDRGYTQSPWILQPDEPGNTRAISTETTEKSDGYTVDISVADRHHKTLAPAETPRNTGQLRISDLVEESQTPESLVFSRPYNRSIPATLSREITDHTPRSENTSALTATDEDSIPILEKKLEALRQYAKDLLELALSDSHAKLLEKIAQLESQIDQRRRRKAELLFSNLNRDFPDLANVAMDEARRRGL